MASISEAELSTIINTSDKINDLIEACDLTISNIEYIKYTLNGISCELDIPKVHKLSCNYLHNRIEELEQEKQELIQFYNKKLEETDNNGK